jgi:uncharacterized membrane protein YkgB
MPTTSITTQAHDAVANRLVRTGQGICRYGLALVVAWIGFGKYLKMDARVLIENSPLMSWTLHVLSASAVAHCLGTLEIIAAILVALRPFSPRISVAGSALTIVLFTGTLSFLFTTSGVVVGRLAGVPVLSALPGQFLLKDLVLMGVAVWTLGDSMLAAHNRRQSTLP